MTPGQDRKKAERVTIQQNKTPQALKDENLRGQDMSELTTNWNGIPVHNESESNLPPSPIKKKHPVVVFWRPFKIWMWCDLLPGSDCSSTINWYKTLYKANNTFKTKPFFGNGDMLISLLTMPNGYEDCCKCFEEVHYEKGKFHWTVHVLGVTIDAKCW